MKIQYLGHACFLVEAKEYRVIIDPFLKGNPQSNCDPKDIKVDAVLLTHGHIDHIGDAVEIAKNCNCPIVSNAEVTGYLEKEGVTVHPMNIGGSFTFDFGKVKLTKAFHSSGITDGDNTLYGGMPAGILLTMDNTTFYHAGDTGLFGDMKYIGEFHQIDVAALPIGDNFTMGPEDALIAAHWIQPKIVVPMHYDTFPVIKQDAQKWAEQVSQEQTKGIALKIGEVLETENRGTVLPFP